MKSTPLPDDAIAHKNRRLTHLVLGFIMLSIGGYVLISGLRSINDKTNRAITPKGYLHLEVADTDEERRVGLMNRRDLDEGSGMLFRFEGEYDAGCFWMKNTYIPLDIIWLDDDKKVIYVHKNATTLSETPICPASNGKYVIEINAGRAEQLGLELGAQVRF